MCAVMARERSKYLKTIIIIIKRHVVLFAADDDVPIQTVASC